MEDEYKEDDALTIEPQGVWGFLEYIRCNVIRPSFRGFLFGLGHFITYKIIGDIISQRLRLSIT